MVLLTAAQLQTCGARNQTEDASLSLDCHSKARLITLIHVLVSCDQCALNCNRT